MKDQCPWGSQMMERLEDRIVLFSWSPEEVYLAELVNRARMDPQAEIFRTSINLTEELSQGELDNLVPQEPLALHPTLTEASRFMSLDMAQRDFFDHDNPDAQDADARNKDASIVTTVYDGSVGENIAVGQDSIDEVHEAWLESVGHRKNVLSLWETFGSNFHYDEMGVGFFNPGQGGGFSWDNYWTQNFGYSGSPQRTYILGVVIDDFNNNNFYDIGEGVGNIRIDVALSSNEENILGSYTTDSAGNYQIVVGAGTYVVSFTNQTTGLTVKKVVNVTGNQNEKLDTELSEIVFTPDLPPVNDVAGQNSSVNASLRANGDGIVTTLNQDGRPIAFKKAGTSWSVADLQSQAGGSTPTGQVETFTDPKDGGSYAAAPTASGLTLYDGNGALWTSRILTNEINGSTNIVSDLTVFTDRLGNVKIGGIDANGDLVLYEQTGSLNINGEFEWTFRNLSQDLRDMGAQTPQFTGSLISYVTSWNGQNIAGLDADGNIHTVWWAPGFATDASRWRTSNLSEITGAAPMSGGLSAYLPNGWVGINIVGVDTNGNLSVTWWVDSFGGDWQNANFTQDFGGPTLLASSVFSYVMPWDAFNIVGIDENGKLVVFWWEPSGNTWTNSPLSDIAANGDLPVGSVRGAASPSGDTSIVTKNTDGDVLHYHWSIGENWQMENLTDLV